MALLASAAVLVVQAACVSAGSTAAASVTVSSKPAEACPNSTSDKEKSRSALACLWSLGSGLYQQRRLTEAETPLVQALVLTDRLGTAKPDDLGELLKTLTLVEVGLGKFEAARRYAERNVELAGRSLPPDPSRIAQRLLITAVVETNAGRYAEAEKILGTVLDREAALAVRDPMLEAAALRYLGNAQERQGRLAEAEKSLLEAVALLSAQKGSNAFDLAASLSDLAFVYMNEGKLQESEKAASHSLGLRQDNFGPEDASVAESLSQLGMIYSSLGRYSEGEAALKRAIAISTKLDGPDNLRVAAYNINLGLLYSAAGQHGEAVALLESAYRIRSKVLGRQHSDTVTARNDLATAYIGAGTAAKALPLLKENAAISEKTLGKSHPYTGLAYNNLGALYQSLNDNRRAEQYYRSAIAIAASAFGPDHPWVSRSWQSLAGLYLSEANWKLAAEASTEAAASVIRRIRRENLSSKSLTGVDESQTARAGQVFDWMVLSLYAYGRTMSGDTRQITERAFLASQWIASSAAANAVGLMAARQARPDTDLGALIREREDAAAQWHKTDQALTDLITAPSGQDLDRQRSVRAELAALDAKIAEIDTQLGRNFPDYTSLARPEPLDIRQVQADLREGETLLFYVDTAPVAGIASKTFLWVVSRGGATFLPLNARPEEIATQIRQLRAAMGTGDVTRGVTPADEPGAAGEDLVLAQQLHAVLISPVQDELQTTRTLIIVPSPSLAGLPFQILVAKSPGPDSADPYQSASWLVQQFAIETLPSVTALHSLRQVSKPSQASSPYVGIGDPVLGVGAVANDTDCNTVVAADETTMASQRGAVLSAKLVTLDRVRDLPSLPETADELCAVARMLGAPSGSVLLGPRATEARIKAMSASGALANSRFVHFATHGLTAAEIEGLSEPALVLTPPAVSSAEDDGLLTASEVAGLRLDADWVVLSACNTAAPEHGDTDLLSGLARAFFYAGARSLLVSNWAVDSEAAVALTTGAVRQLAAAPSAGKAEALRRSMLSLIRQGGRKARPAYWAPLSLVSAG